MYNALPIFRNTELDLHVLRVPTTSEPSGSNHNTDHQAARHGPYVATLAKLNRETHKATAASALHIHEDYYISYLSRGYVIDKGMPKYNDAEVSGDQLIGMMLGMKHHVSEDMKVKFIDLIEQMILDDYSLRNGTIKSESAMWQPGIETFGAQCITILAALRLAAKYGSRKAKRTYLKLFWLHGYGLLSLLPTIFTMKHRNYFNDNNMAMATYVLAQNATNEVAYWYWSVINLFVWTLSYKWYNGFTTGMTKQLWPRLISDKYVNKCKNFLYEQEPMPYDIHIEEEIPAKRWPLKLSERNMGEFLPEEDQLVIRKGRQKSHSALGWVVQAVFLDERECKDFLTKDQ